MNYFFFVVFSAIEGIAIFIATLSIYRFRFQKYLWQASIISILQALISHFLRNEQDFAQFVPIISICLIIFLIYAFVVNNFFWCIVMAITGFFYFGVVQSSLLTLLQWTHIVTLERVQTNTLDTYLLQGITAIVTISSSLLLYNKGLGLAFDFDRFKFKGENGIIMAIITITLVAIGYIFLKNSLFMAALAFIISLVFLLIFLIKKELK